MQNFKFGDVVRHKENGELFVVSDFGEDEGFVAAMCKSDAVVWDIEADKLELIPHPDTVRLDWFESNKGMLMAHPRQHAIEQDIPEYQFFGLKKTNGKTLREAIDSAMGE